MLKFSTAAACGGLVVAAAVSVAAIRGPAEAQGIFQKLTGGAAAVTFSMDSPRRGNKSAVVIEVTARQSVKARRIYVQLRCAEIVEIANYGVPAETDQKDQKSKAAEKSKTVNVRKEESCFSKEFTLAGAQTSRPTRPRSSRARSNFRARFHPPTRERMRASNGRRAPAWTLPAMTQTAAGRK